MIMCFSSHVNYFLLDIYIYVSRSPTIYYDALEPELKMTPLHLAAKEGKLAVVNELLQQGGIDVNDTNNYYVMSPLHIAAEKGHLAVVKALLKRNDINVNQKSKFDRDPLWFADTRGHHEVANLLRERMGIEPKQYKTWSVPDKATQSNSKRRRTGTKQKQYKTSDLPGNATQSKYNYKWRSGGRRKTRRITQRRMR